MPRQTPPKGQCAFCGTEIAKSAAPRHLAVCPKRQAAMAAPKGGRGSPEKLYHLRVRSADSPAFWLELEMRGSATLNDLDHYLRHIWLECCGHLSQFSVGGWRGEEFSMGEQIQAVFRPGLELTHIYDFGTTSETLIKAVAIREGKPLTKHPIVLMMRNNAPHVPCTECAENATHLCLECLMEMGQWVALCSQHADGHTHDDFSEPTPLVNSPRLGMCGYDGPAEPPY